MELHNSHIPLFFSKYPVLHCPSSHSNILFVLVEKVHEPLHPIIPIFLLLQA